MKRPAWTLRVTFLSTAALLLASPVFAQKQSPDELFTKARNAISPTLMGPHHLEAEVMVLLAGGKKGKGTYSLDWAAPDRFREEIHMPGYDEIKVASGTTLYRKRNIDYIPARVFELEMLMHPSADLDRFVLDVSRLLHPPGYKTTSGDQAALGQLAVGHGRLEDAPGNCISPASGVPELCVDAGRGWPLQISEDTQEIIELLQFSDYAKFGDAYISRKRQYLENGANVVEVSVKKTSTVQHFDAAAFAPPAGAEQVPWCYDMVPAARQEIKAPATISPDDFPEPEVLYGVVGAYGTLSRVSIIESGGAKADADIRALADSLHFTPATCGGKPVESETRFVVSYLDFSSTLPPVQTVEAGKNGYGTPSCLYCPTPPFTSAAYQAKIHGVVIMDVTIGADGRAHNIRVKKSAGYGLDEQALQTVRNIWRFKPATGPDGKPAAVHTLIEVDFNVY